jgi:hypothetical protein
MYRRTLAFDFEGTWDVKGDIPPEVEASLEQCRASGHVVFFVTGRRTIRVSHRERVRGHRGRQLVCTVPVDSAAPAGEPRVSRSSRRRCKMGRRNA